jgi:TatD DNase family protein
VQLHAFDGKFGAAMPAVEAGFFFSIPASVARSRQKQKLVHQLPISCLLLETDSPVLGPEPGRRNEPVNVRLALQSIAEIKEVSTEGLAEAIYENTRRLYGQIF